MRRWTTEEELVALYYASRNVKHATIVDILAKKCSTEVRTQKQVTSKLVRLRIASGQNEVVEVPGAPQIRRWDRKLADQWLFSMMEKERLQELLEFDNETAAIIGQVSMVWKTPARFHTLIAPWQNNHLEDFVGIMALDDGTTADHQDTQFTQGY